MIVFEVNLLLYAHDATSKDHHRAATWLERALSSREIVGFAWATLRAFLRISTEPRIISQPYDLDQARSIVSEWLSRSNVAIVSPSDQHWVILNKLLPASRTRGSLIMDAHLAAFAIEHERLSAQMTETLPDSQASKSSIRCRRLTLASSSAAEHRSLPPLSASPSHLSRLPRSRP